MNELLKINLEELIAPYLANLQPGTEGYALRQSRLNILASQAIRSCQLSAHQARLEKCGECAALGVPKMCAIVNGTIESND
jgi:hypothetical protein